MHYRISNLEHLSSFAKEFISRQTKKVQANLVLLSGDLGAGKTAFVQACAQALGINEALTSPTFVIQKEYLLDGKVFSQLIHIDAYRLEGKHELEYLKWEETMMNPQYIIFLEWPEMVSGIQLPDHYTKITIILAEGDAREINIEEN